MKELRIRDNYITLGQALKLCGEVSTGFEAKVRIQEGEVTVNHEVETRRGKKLYDGDVFEIDHQIYVIHAD